MLNEQSMLLLYCIFTVKSLHKQQYHQHVDVEVLTSHSFTHLHTNCLASPDLRGDQYSQHLHFMQNTFSKKYLPSTLKIHTH